MTWKQGLFGFGYILFFMLCASAMIWWQRRQRKSRKPFGDDLKLLRGPGESQFKIYLKEEEDGILWLFFAALVPAGVLVLGLQIMLILPDPLKIAAFGVSVLGFIAAFYYSTRWYSRRTQSSFNRYLGYFGERIVAEHLEPLKQQGWRIFHDVPCQNNGTKFNIDHIAVGPNGVFVIETKTRRKGGARPGFDDHKVYFDGRALVWPWGEDNHGLEQAERNAVWLKDTIKAEIGENVFVTPFLTLPGWWVENKPSRDSRLCRVVNSKVLAKFLPNGPETLDPKQIDAIAAKLEARCRDVEY
jgi:hypothetical protein